MSVKSLGHFWFFFQGCESISSPAMSLAGSEFPQIYVEWEAESDRKALFDGPERAGFDES
jgi:hypothetical protein